MKVRIFSDIHNEFERWSPIELDTDSETTLILAGDLWTGDRTAFTIEWLAELSKRFANIVVVLGNHDYWRNAVWRSLPKLIDESTPDNVYCLQNNSIVIDGEVIAGCTLWTDLDNENPSVIYGAVGCTNDFMQMHIAEFKTKDWLEEFAKSKEFILTNPVDILITHYMPSSSFTDPKFKGSFCNPLFSSDLVEYMINYYVPMPRYWIYGHTHTPGKATILDTQFICNPRGYPNENSKFDEESFYEFT